MIEQDRKALIAYRLEQADQSLEDADLLLANARYKAAINRSYYAMFYAAQGMLLLKDLGTSEHSGVLSLLDREFVKEHELPKEFSHWIHEAFHLRQRADYEIYYVASRTDAEMTLENAKRFVQGVKERTQV